MSNLVGGWEVKVAVGKFPQKVATAIGDLNTLFGVEYEGIAYLGSQVVNGTNHAVLLEQNIVTGKDTKNIVLAIFHETKDGVALANIERVAESGGELGGLKIDVQTTIPEDAQAAFDGAFEAYVGVNVKPFALLATQVTKGTNYVFAAEVTNVVPDATPEIALIVVNPLTKDLSFVNILGSKSDVSGLVGYAFSWLRK